MKQLTEQELLNMPASAYMNEEQLAFFRDRLMAMRDEIMRNVDQTVQHMREAETVSDPADRATVEEEHTLELRTRDRERKLLHKIEQSIARIAEGNYGYCDETGDPIGLKRLLIRPTATLSVEAQERRERRQKQYSE